jgi:hypothetical protein
VLANSQESVFLSTCREITVRIFQFISIGSTAPVVYWSEFLAIYAEVLGLIPGATRFSEK